MYRRQLGGDAWDLVVIGDGPERPRIEARREALALQGSVHLAGFQQYPDLPAYYGLASGFILASASDQWGLVVNEAMASGLPVLVSHACGASELVRDGELGFRFDPLSPADMARAMAELTREGPRLADMGHAARAALVQLSPATFAKALVRAVELGRDHRALRRNSPLPNPALWF
jgi:glycosyltransferase involved in cell wall biosynthesis